MRYLICALIPLMILSCKKKEEKYIITGKVIIPELNVPANNASVTLWGTKVNQNLVQNMQEKIGQTNVQADGTFRFEFDKLIYSNLKLYVTRHDCFDSEKAINPDNLSLNEEYNLLINLHIKAWLKTEIKKISQNTNSKVFYKLTLPYNDCTSCCNTNQINFPTTNNLDTSWVCAVYGNNYVYLTWITTNANNPYPHNDTIFIPHSDTVYFPIFY
jgi:hypothetical protein